MQRKIRDTVISNCRFNIWDDLFVDACSLKDSLKVSTLPANLCILLVVNNREHSNNPKATVCSIRLLGHTFQTLNFMHSMLLSLGGRGGACVFLPQHTLVYKEKCTDLFLPC